jgi:hypothetical protein
MVYVKPRKMPTNNTSRSKPPFQVFYIKILWFMVQLKYEKLKWICCMKMNSILFWSFFFFFKCFFFLFKFFLVCCFYVSLFGFSVCFFLSTRSIKKTRSSMLTIVLWNIITQLWPFTLLMSLRQIRQWIYINLFLLIPYCINFFSLQRSSTWQGTIKFGIWTFW